MITPYHDTSGIACPSCHDAGLIRFTEMPESLTTYTINGEHHTIHNGAGREYACGNCGTEWTMYCQEEVDDGQHS